VEPKQNAYLRATTMTFLGIIFGQVGTAFAVRTQRGPLIVWGADELRRFLIRRSASPAGSHA
jgi:hypothetical protein